MKLFRYRRPSLTTILAMRKAKKRVKKELGITAAMKPFRFWTNAAKVLDYRQSKLGAMSHETVQSE